MFLERRLAQGSEHPVGHRQQARPGLLELLCQPIVPLSQALIAFRHSNDGSNPASMTNRWVERRWLTSNHDALPVANGAGSPN
jgi:hypothetical protein